MATELYETDRRYLDSCRLLLSFRDALYAALHQEPTADLLSRDEASMMFSKVGGE